jgi:hypothetical protein
LQIDLALDAVAIRLGLWDWGQPLDWEFFGVPYANFWAWFWVVFSFSFGYRLFARRTDWVGTWLSSLLALIVGLTGVLGANAFLAFVIPFIYDGVAVTMTLILALGLVITLHPKFYLRPVPSLTFWVPFTTHMYILIAGLISGLILNPPFLLFIGIAMVIIAFYLYQPAIKQILSLK